MTRSPARSLFAKAAAAAFALGVLTPASHAAHAPVVALPAFATAATATAASDSLTLKDGRVLEGVVEREVNGYIWFRTRIGGIEQVQMYRPEDITKLERGVSPKADPTTPTAPAGEPKPAETPADAGAAAGSGVPRGVVLTLGWRPDTDMVGMYMNAKPLQDAIPMLEEELGTDGSGVVVLRIDSGGGLLLEIARLHKVIEEEIMPRFRTVGWIKWAISAAAMTAHVVHEIYFYPEGNYGGATGFNGATMEAIKDRGLEDVLFMMEKASARGKKAPEIMRSMQILEPLSATIDANGDVKWFQDETSGEILVNPGTRVLTFTSDMALRTKFSKGTTDDLRELTRLMGYQELNWVGKTEAGTPWPVSRSEEIQRRFRAKTHEDEKATNAYFLEYQGAIEIAQGQQNRTERGRFVGRARTALGKIQSMVKNNPNFALLVLNQPNEAAYKQWVEEQERMLRDMMR